MPFNNNNLLKSAYVKSANVKSANVVVPSGHLGILLSPPVAPKLQTGQKHIYEKLEALSTSQRVKILSCYRL